MDGFQKRCRDYARVAQAIRYLETDHQHQPSLVEVARAVNLSEFHFQRLLSRWVGISLKRFSYISPACRQRDATL